MIKLKLVSLPKAIQFKSKISLPKVTLANFQEKNVIPTKELQEITADQGFDGLSKVNVEPISDKYGDITEYFLTSYSGSNPDFRSYIKKIPSIDLGNITNIIQFFHSFSSLEEFPYIDTSKVTGMYNTFYNCYSMKKNPDWNYENVTNFGQTFSYSGITELELYSPNATNMSGICRNCSNLKKIISLDTRNVTNMSGAFGECRNLTDICELDFSNVINVGYLFNNTGYIENVGGFKNYGKAFTEKTANYTNYILNFSSHSKLTHESVINILNDLYDLNLTYDVANGGTLYTQKIRFYRTVFSKITDEEKKIATDKGWTITS